MKLLIDECLSVALVEMATAAGNPESAHVTRRGMTGWKDHQLMKAIIEDDWMLVTRNSNDFRPKPGHSSQAPCYLGQPLHAGLICLNLPAGSGRGKQTDFRVEGRSTRAALFAPRRFAQMTFDECVISMPRSAM